MAASIPSLIRDGGSFPGGKRAFMAALRVFARRRIAGHAAFARADSVQLAYFL
jgi:hypothetical protein